MSTLSSCANEISPAPTTVSIEQHLSPQLDSLSPLVHDQHEQQVSPNTVQSPAPISSTHPTISSMLGIDFETIPDYLRQANPFFERKIRCTLPSIVQVEDLRDVAILIYKIQCLDIVQSLWITYHQSGTGNLQILSSIPQIETKIWPKNVQALAKKFHLPPSHGHADDDDGDHVCLTFVKHCLHELDAKRHLYEHELKIKTNSLRGYARSLEHTVKKLVKEKLQSLRFDIAQRIASVQYDYKDRMLKNAYLAQNPNPNQIEIMKLLCKLQYDAEVTKHELLLLKEKTSSSSYLTSCRCEDAFDRQISCIKNIRNSKRRAQLYKQYKHVNKLATSHQIAVHLECAKGHQEYCRKLKDSQLKQVKNMQKALPIDQRVTATMWNIINQRLNNISAHITHRYKHKTQLFRSMYNDR